MNPRVRTDLVFRQLDDEWVVFDPETQRLHALNLTAALVWEHCTGDLTVDQIADAVARAFRETTEPSQVLADVRATVQRFADEGLLA